MGKSRRQFHVRNHAAIALAASAAAAIALAQPGEALAQRVTGIDVSEWQGDLSQTTWNNVKGGTHPTGARSFAFIRSSRGGTTGFYNQSDAWNELRRNTLSQRFDDRYWEQNATRAVAAGLFIGPYHFGRQDVFTNSGGTVKYGDSAQGQGTPSLSTAWFNYGDVANQGADEARHFLQQAGPWMKPGYLMPVFDHEAGERQLNATQQSQFGVAFANQIKALKGVAPIIYVNQNYAINEADLAMAAAMPNNWVARWPNQTNPELVDIQNGNPPPSPSTANVYGQWYPAGQPYPTPQPWKFWQYGSQNTNVAGISPVDVDVAHGDIEYLKEMLVPALWTKTNVTSSGLWSDVHNWNSDIDPSGKGPAARLPGSVATLGVIDTVVLDSANYSNAVTFDASAGTQSIRKLVVRNETLNITGGTLNVIYNHVAPRAIDLGPEPWSVLVDGTVTLSGTGQLGAPRIDVATGRTLNLNGGTLGFTSLNLLGTGSVAVGGDIALTPWPSIPSTIATTGSGEINLGGGTRAITVTGDPALYQVAINVPISNGALTKAGSGTMILNANNSGLNGAVAVNEGPLTLSGAAGAVASASGYTLNTGGTLTLDNTATANANRISSNPITMNGGTLSIIGNASSTVTETGGNLTAALGASTVTHGANGPRLALGVYARAAGATINFSSANSTNRVSFSSGVSAGNFINQGTFVNSGDYAVYDAAGYVRAMIIGAGVNDYSTSVAANRHVRLTVNGAVAAPTTINTLTLAGATVGFTMSPGANLTLTSGGVVKGSGGASSISGSANLVTGAGTEYVFNMVNGADTLTVSSPITGGSGLTKTGAGVLVLGSGANTYGGATTVARGTLRLGVANAVPDASNLTVAGGATFSANGFTDTIGNVTLHDGHISGAGTITIGSANNSITYTAGSTGSTLATNTTLGTAAGTTTFTIADGAVVNDLYVTAVLGGGGGGVRSINKTGAGTLTLAGNNSFTGGVTVSEGTLSLAAINATAAANQPLGNNTATITVGSATPAALHYSGVAAATLNRGINVGGVGGVGGATVRATAGALTLGATVAGGGNPVTFDTAGGDIAVNAEITGAGTSVTKTGPGTLTLNSANTFTGGLNVNAGVVAYPFTTALGGGVAFNGGTLRALVGGTNPHFLQFNAAGGTFDTNGFDVTLNNVLAGAGGLTKVGAGTLTISNIASYTGPTTVNAGTLNVTGSTHASSSAMVYSGGTLAGTGTIGGNVHLVTGGAINLTGAGNILGSLTANGGTWNGGGLVNGAVNVNTYNASFNVNGTLTTNTGVNVDMGTLGGSGTIAGNVNLTNAGAINLGAAGNITGAVTVGAGGGTWTGSGSVAGNITVTSDAFGVTGNVILNPPSFNSATLGGAGTLTMNAGTTLWGWGTINKSVVLNNNVRLAGTPARGALTINSPVTWGATGLQIYGGTIATQGDTITGALQISGTARGQLGGAGTATVNGGAVTLLGAADIAKPTVLTGGGALTFTSYVDKDTGPTPDTSGAGDSTYFGTITGTLAVNGAGGSWAGRGTVTGAINASAGNFALASNAQVFAPAGLSVSGTGTMTGAASSLVTGSVTYTSSAANIWAGNITGATSALNLTDVAANVTFAGTNTYGGGTNIASGTLTLTGDGQIVNGSIVTGSSGTLQLSGNVSYALPLTLGGAGDSGAIIAAPGGVGALNNLSDDNAWTGPITLNGTGSNGGDALLNQIGSTAGTLVVSGVIQGGLGSSWAKTGNGDVVLTGGAANAYTNLTRLFGGRLIIEKDGALGAAGSNAAAAGNTFQLVGSQSTLAFRAEPLSVGLNYATFEVINTEGAGAPGFGQVDNLSGHNTFAGQVALGGPVGVGGMIDSSIGVNADSLHLTGPLYARAAAATPRNITKLGVGRLILSADSSPATANVNVVPLQNSTFNVNAGVVELRSPGATTTNLPGVTTWNVNPGAAVHLATGLLSTGALNVSGDVTVAAGGGKVVRVQALNLSGAGKLDLADNLMITNNALGTATAGTYNGLQGDVQRAYNFGAWNAPGLTTSMPDALAGITTVGVATGEQIRGLGPTDTDTWGGQVISGASTLAMYTYAGDANLDGQVDAGDYGILDAFIQVAGASGYGNGDFNYDGFIDPADYGTIDNSIQFQGAPFPTAGGVNTSGSGAVSGGAVTAVPEPCVVGVVGVLGATLSLRRRRRR